MTYIDRKFLCHHTSVLRAGVGHWRGSS